MSTQYYRKVILQEIEKLNDRIDLKILRGKPYTKEARRHKSLLEQFNYFESQSRKKSHSGSFFSFLL